MPGNLTLSRPGLAACQLANPALSWRSRAATSGRPSQASITEGSSWTNTPSPNCSIAGSQSRVSARGAPETASLTSSMSSSSVGAGSNRVKP
jgi:hypothetical protein